MAMTPGMLFATESSIETTDARTVRGRHGHDGRQELGGREVVVGVGPLAPHDVLQVHTNLGLTDDLPVLGRLRRSRRGLRKAGRQRAELAVADLAAVTGDHVGVLGPQGGNRDTELLGSRSQKLAPHLGADDPDGVVQNADVVRAAGDLGGAPLLLGRRALDVHVLERDVEVVGHHHGVGGEPTLADLGLRPLGVDPVVGLDLNQEVVDRRLLAGYENVREVLVVREFIGLRRPSVGAVGEPQAGSDRERGPGDQKALQDCTTLNRRLKR